MNLGFRRKGREAMETAEGLKQLPVRTICESVLDTEDNQLTSLKEYLKVLELDRTTLATSLASCDAAIAETAGCIAALEPAIKKINGLIEKTAGEVVRDIAEEIKPKKKDVVEAEA